MKLLILGGTVFLGRHIVEAALAQGDEVTLFNRGRSNPGLFSPPAQTGGERAERQAGPRGLKGVETLVGDRDGGLEALRGGRWDAVIDTSGFLPRIVGASAQMLSGAAGHYTFISSGSVYAEDSVAGLDETAAVQTLSHEGSEEVAKDYGALKALCESAVERAMPGRALHVRFGLLVGPHDPTNRFTYWPRRISEGGEVLAPGRPDRQVQFIDARDGARWILDSVRSARITGVYNVTGPRDLLTMGALLGAVRDAVGREARLTWVEEPFLLAREVAPWTDLPLWLPDAMRGALSVSIDKALRAGLSFRPLAETVRDTLAWDAARPPELRDGAARLSIGSRKIGLSRQREAEILAEWRASGGGR